jgi:hypothetical protein
MSVQFPTTQAPFDTIKERSQIDGTAFYVGVLVMALDEMAKVCGLDVDQTLPLLVKEMDTADLTVQTFRELEDPSLSLQEVQDLGKLAMDALLTVVEHGPLAVVDAVKLAINILDALWTNVHELLDTVEGNAFHLWTFGTHGNTWAQPLPGIEQTDWESVEIPGDWFDAQQSQIQLAAGNNWDVTTSHGPVSVVAASGHPVYGDLFGNRQTVGAIMVTVYQGAEDHDMAVKDEEAQGWVFFKSGSAGVVPFAVIQPRLVPWSWKLNPHGTHISTVGAIQIQTGRVIVPAETFYGPGDTAGLHPQHSNQYTWTWQSGQMIPPPDVFCGNAFCQP